MWRRIANDSDEADGDEADSDGAKNVTAIRTDKDINIKQGREE